MLSNVISINNLNYINKEHIQLLYPIKIYAILCYTIRILRLINIDKLKLKICGKYVKKAQCI